MLGHPRGAQLHSGDYSYLLSMLRRLDVRTAQHRILVSAINWQSLYDLVGRMITLSIVIVDAWNLRLSVVLADLPIGDFFPVVERSPPGRARQPPPPRSNQPWMIRTSDPAAVLLRGPGPVLSFISPI